jgi:hypothetical protein
MGQRLHLGWRNAGHGQNPRQALKVVGVPRHQVLRKAGAAYSQLVRDAKNMGHNLSQDWTLAKVPSVHTRTRGLVRCRLHMSVDCHHTAACVSGRHRMSCKMRCNCTLDLRDRQLPQATAMRRRLADLAASLPVLSPSPTGAGSGSPMVRSGQKCRCRRQSPTSPPRQFKMGAGSRRCRAGIPKHCRVSISISYLPGHHRHTSSSTMHVAGTMRRLRHRYNDCHVTDHVCSTTAANSKILFQPRLTHHDTRPR